MTLSIKRNKQLTNFGYTVNTNFKYIDSPSLTLAKKQNKLEEERCRINLLRLEKETSKNLIKLSKNIYETHIELNSIHYELKRNKLETIYKNYNFCSDYRNNYNNNEEIKKKKKKKKDIEIDKQNNSDNNNNNNNNNDDDEDRWINETIVEQNKNTKEEKLNNFLTDLSTKTETEINYMLAVTSTSAAAIRRPKTVASAASATRISFKNRSNNDNERNCKSASVIHDRRAKSFLIKNNKEQEEEVDNKAFKELNIEMSSQSVRSLRKKETKQPTIETIIEVCENVAENTVNSSSGKKKVKNDYLAPRSLTPTPHVYLRKGSGNKYARKRTSSLPKIRYDPKSEDDEISDGRFSSASKDSSIRVASSISRKSMTSTTSTKKKKKAKSGDSSLLQINDLYEKSIENLDRMSSRCEFNNSLDDDDWLRNLVDLKTKQRETIKLQRGKFRVCSAWQSKLVSRHNIELTTRIRQNHLTRRAKNANSLRFDMNKEKELFELTHRNLKDLMIKKIHASQAKTSENTVKEYVQSVAAVTPTPTSK